MKTALSIPDELFKEVERFAQEHNYSRSKVFAEAVKEWLEKARARAILDSLNKAYADEDTTEEMTVRKKSRAYYASRILKEKY